MQMGMSAIIFLVGVATIVIGMVIILGREYQEAMRTLSKQSVRVGGRAVTEADIAPVVDAMSRLLESVTKLIATAVGVGAFLVLLGAGLAVAGFWMATLIK
jgi:hypothetical protein